jgi:hypothetical protein
MRAILTLFLIIASITTLDGQALARSPKLNYDWRPGFVSITELNGANGLMSTSAKYSQSYYGITTAAGYQFTRNLKALLGAGIQVHNGGSLFPVFLDARYSFNAQEFVPFIAATGGIALNFNDTEPDPLYHQYIFINPGIGLKYVAANRTAVSLSTGLMIMSATESRNSFINFKLGIELKGK